MSNTDPFTFVLTQPVARANLRAIPGEVVLDLAGAKEVFLTPGDAVALGSQLVALAAIAEAVPEPTPDPEPDPVPELEVEPEVQEPTA